MSRATRRIGNAGSVPRIAAARVRVLEAHPGPRSMTATRGRPARSGSTRQVQPASRAPTSATIASPWSAPISSSAIPSSARRRGSRSSRRPIDLEAVGAAVEGERRLEGRRRPGAPPSRRRGRTAGWRGRSSQASVRRPAAGGRRPRTAAGRRRRAPPRSRAPGRARPARCPSARIATSSAGTRRRAAGRRRGRSRWRRCPSRRRATAASSWPGRPHAERVSRRMISASARSTRRSVSGRGISARASTVKASPWNSLMPRM